MIGEAGIMGLGWAELLVGAGIILVILEIISPSFFFLGFAIGAFAAAGWVALANPSFQAVLIVFGIVSAGSFVVLRKIFRKRGDTHRSGSDVNRY